ncbi:MAG: metal-dependent hydrolase [Methylobacillus glycogenes]|nr:metal-dependent hydrolase [Methylobacillus glycogenes]
MFIAHAPSGYLLAQAIIKKCPNIGVSTKAILWVGIIGAVFPDIDMLYFYLIDHRQHHHHTYLTHWPISWLVLLVLALLLSRWAASKNLAKLLGIFAVAGFLHLMLDTLVGDVWWFAPWVDQSYRLFTVEALYKPWWLSFFLHWSFGVELLICLAAAYVYLQNRMRDFDLEQGGDH